MPDCPAGRDLIIQPWGMKMPDGSNDGFCDLIDRSTDFFTKLKANNTKPFYEEHKAFYTAQIKKPAELLLDVIGDKISRKTGVGHKGKLFRIHRDVRFSKDKTPYNAHLHLLWSQPSEGAPAWFFGAAPEYLTLGTGVMGLKGEPLTQYRTLIDRDGDAVQNAIQAAAGTVQARVSDWGPEPLKRVPKPYNPDHRHGALLKRKALAVTADLPIDWRAAGLVTSVMTVVDGLLPVWAILNDEFG